MLEFASGFSLPGKHPAIELVDNTRNVSAGLVVRGDAVIFVDGGRTGVVGGKSERDVVVIAAE